MRTLAAGGKGVKAWLRVGGVRKDCLRGMGGEAVRVREVGLGRGWQPTSELAGTVL